MQPGSTPGRIPCVRSTNHTESEKVMRTQLIMGALAVAATSALVRRGTAPGSAQTMDPRPDPSAPGVTHERGALMECTGSAGTIPVRANLCQNKTYGNY